MTRFRGLRAALLLVLALPVLLLLPASTGRANASSLIVHAGTSTGQVLARCQSSTVAVTGTLKPPAATLTTVTVSGLDAVACSGLPVLVELVDPSTGGTWAGALQASGTGTVTAGSISVSTNAFAPASGLVARVVVGGWTVPSTWAFTAGGLRCVDTSGAGRQCTVVVDRYSVWNGGYRLDFHVTSTSLIPFRYEVQADLSATGLALGGTTGFPGWPVPASAGHPQWYPKGLSPTNVCVSSSATDLPVIALRGSGTGWNDYVAAWMPATSLGFQVSDSITSFPTWDACTY